MAAAPFIASLNRQLSSQGQYITLTRMTGSDNQAESSVRCLAIVRQYDPSELGEGIIQGDSLLIVGLDEINNASWPGGRIGPTVGDPRVPVKGDKVMVAGTERSVEVADPLYVAGTLVRLNIRVRG